MTGKLQDSIAEANRKAGLSRQRIFAKKSFLKQGNAQVIEMLCARAEEAVTAIRTGNGKAELTALSQAVTVARRHLEKK